MSFDLRTRIATCEDCRAQFHLREKTPTPGMICYPACTECGTALHGDDDDLVGFVVVRRIAQPIDPDQS